MSQDPAFSSTDLRLQPKGYLRNKLAALIVTRPSPRQLARIRTVR